MATRLGLVGCGRWGSLILRDLHLLGCDVAVVARSEASVERARTGNAASIHADLDQLPDDVEGLVVATTTATHADVVARCLERPVPVPVFVEKPLTADTTSARTLAATAPDRLFVMDKWRYHPGVQRLAGLARSGTLGTITGLRTTRVDWGLPHTDVDCTWILAPHDLSIALEVLGAIPDPVAAVAHTDAGVVTGLLGTLRLPDGRWHHLEVSARSTTNERRVELHGDEGMAVLAGGWDDVVTIHRDVAGAHHTEHLDATGELPLLAELRTFVEHLHGGPPPRSSAAEGARTVEVIDQLRALAGVAPTTHDA